MPSMRVSPAAAYPSARLAPVRAPSPDNSGASSAPSSSLPDLEVAAGPFLRLVGVAASFPASPLAGERETRIPELWPADMKTFRVGYNPMGAPHTESKVKTTPRQRQNNSERKNRATWKGEEDLRL